MVNADAPLATLSLLIQFQCRDFPAVEVTFSDVSRFEFDRAKDVWEADLQQVDGGWRFRFMTCVVVARDVVWEPLDADALGPPET